MSKYPYCLHYYFEMFKLILNMERILLKTGQRILFVCYGNICRSPMAEGLAKKLFGHKIKVESAGIAASGGSAAEEAVEIMKLLYNVDISRHHSRHTREISFEKFDFIIALDRVVYLHLRDHYKIELQKLIEWHIEDPIFRGISFYEKVIQKIQYKMINTFEI